MLEWMFWFAAAVAVFCFVLYIIALTVNVKNEVAESPKVPMLLCEKHGLLPEKFFIELDVLDDGKPVKRCPICFEERIKEIQAKR